jgi:hypothetical protein
MIGSKILDTLIINADKESRRPSSRKRQSAKLWTLIFNLVKVEERNFSERRKNTGV